MPATLLKKRLWHRCFPENFAKFLKTPHRKEHLQWLLLQIVYAFPPFTSISKYQSAGILVPDWPNQFQKLIFSMNHKSSIAFTQNGTSAITNKQHGLSPALSTLTSTGCFGRWKATNYHMALIQ